MNTGIKDRAYPRSIHEETGAYIFGASCASGKGGGSPFNPIGYNMEIIEYKVPKFDVYNRKLILFNRKFDVYEDSGIVDPLYAGKNSPGDRVDWYLGFGVDDTLTGDDIVSQNIKITDAYPIEISVDDVYLPQPTDVGWVNKIFIYMYWVDPNYLISNYQLPVTLDVIKHDYDIKI